MVNFLSKIGQRWHVITWVTVTYSLNTLRPRQNGRHFADDIFKGIFFNENVWILIKFSLKFVPKGPINNIPSLVQIMAWRRPGNKPLSEPRMESLLTHIWITRPQWVNRCLCSHIYNLIIISCLQISPIWGLVCQKLSRAGTRNYIPQIFWDVISYPCLWYPFLVHNGTVHEIVVVEWPGSIDISYVSTSHVVMGMIKMFRKKFIAHSLYEHPTEKIGMI